MQLDIDPEIIPEFNLSTEFYDYLKRNGIDAPEKSLQAREIAEKIVENPAKLSAAFNYYETNSLERLISKMSQGMAQIGLKLEQDKKVASTGEAGEKRYYIL